jgi:hypothetical protein
MHAAAQVRSEAAHHGIVSFVGNPRENDPVRLGPAGRIVTPDHLRVAVRPHQARRIENRKVRASLRMDAGHLRSEPRVIRDHERLAEDWACDRHRTELKRRLPVAR